MSAVPKEQGQEMRQQGHYTDHQQELTGRSSSSQTGSARQRNLLCSRLVSEEISPLEPSPQDPDDADHQKDTTNKGVEIKSVILLYSLRCGSLT